MVEWYNATRRSSEWEVNAAHDSPAEARSPQSRLSAGPETRQSEPHLLGPSGRAWLLGNALWATRPRRTAVPGRCCRRGVRKSAGSALTLYPDTSGRFSEYACGTPLRSPPKGLPGPTGRGMHHRASFRFKPTGTRFKRMAPRPRYVDAFTRRNDVLRNAHTACSWQGARCPIHHSCAERGNRQGERAMHPLAQAEGRSGPFPVTRCCAAAARHGIELLHSAVHLCNVRRGDRQR